MSETVAAIDCGTNSIRLLIGRPPEVDVRELRMVRLGQGVDRSGLLTDEALQRTFAAIDEYAALIDAHGATRVRFCGTSATRDAGNAEVFAHGVRERLGVDPEVLTGAEEATLSFEGAVRHLESPPALPVLVVDIGGGSTELILGSEVAEPPEASVSMDIGSVRLTERHLPGDPPTRAQIDTCVHQIDRYLDECGVPVERAATVVGVAGTVTTLGAGLLGLTEFDADAVDQSVHGFGDLVGLVERLLAMPVSERLELPWLHPGRADVIGAGGLILTRLLARIPGVGSLTVSEADILDGIAWSLLPGHP